MRRVVTNCLRKYRKALGLTQRQVARLMGMKNTSVISRWEKGSCLPEIKNALALALIYRTTTDALFLELRNQLKEQIRKRREKISEEERRGRR